MTIDELLQNAKACQEDMRLEEAIDCYQLALLEVPDNIAVHINLAKLYHLCGRHHDAIKLLRAALSIAPEHLLARRNLSLILLQTGDFEKGWREYEKRLDEVLHLLPPGNMLLPLQKDTDLCGKTILLHTEQGFGDSIQFIRYANLLAEQHAEVIVSCQPELADLFRSMPSLKSVVSHGEPLPPFDYQALLMSMPFIYSTMIKTIPSFTKPYIQADQQRIKRFAARITNLDTLKVGIAWTGSCTTVNTRRFCTLKQFEPLFLINGIDWYSLQVGPGSADAANFTAVLHDYSSELQTFADTAAFIANLDLIITIDTSVAHLAAGLGKPTWILLPFTADWRWLLDREDSPWYPAMRLFRQKKEGDWEELMARVSMALEELKTEFKQGFAGFLATAMRRQTDGMLSDAILLYRQVCAFTTPTPGLLLNLGSALHDTGRYKEALDVYDQALEINVDCGMVWHNRGNTLLELDCYEEAIGSYEQALSTINDDVGALVTIGTALERLGKYEEAVARYQDALERDPGCAEAHWNLALALLRQESYEKGWREFEWRWQKRNYTSPRRDFPQPAWDGQPLGGKTILIHAEQAFGDTLQFVRFLPYVTQQGGNIILECPAPLVPLLATMPNIQKVYASGEPLPTFEYHLPLLSLPFVLSSNLKTIPRLVPYLEAPAEYQVLWKNRFNSDNNIKIGLLWAGRKQPDPHRSCMLNDFAPLADLSGITFYSLQVGEGADQSSAPPTGMNLIDLTGDIRDFADTAAFIAQLDMVISIDTAVAHLAGAMGKPTVLLVPFAPDWRWGLHGTESTWYPTMRIFRQKKLGVWNAAVLELRSFLEQQITRLASGGKLDVGVKNLVSSRLRLFIYRDGEDFFLAAPQKGKLIPLLEALPIDAIQVSDPYTADFLVFPFDLTPLHNFAGFDNTLKFIQSLPHFENLSFRHVFYSSHDDCRTFPTPAIFFKTSVSGEHYTEKTIPVPFQVQDFADQLTFDPNEITYGTSFVGYPGSSQLREKLLLSIAGEKRIRANLDIASKFHYHLTADEKHDRRTRYVSSLKNSLTVLCPRGDGVNSIRYFEALSMGRIPVLISDSCVLPEEGNIAYRDIMLRLAETDVEQAGEQLFNWLGNQTPDRLLERCMQARRTWERFMSPSGTACSMFNTLLGLKGNHTKVETVNEGSVTPRERIYQQGISAYKEKLYLKAVNLFQELVSLDPARTDAYLMLGQAYYSLGRPAKAEECFKRVLNLDPDYIDGYSRLGLLYIEWRRPKKAIDILERGISVNPSNALLLQYLGEAYGATGNHQDAFHWLKLATLLDQNNPRSLLKLGIACYRLDRYEEAESAFISAKQMNPEDYQPYLNLGGVYQALNRLSDAEHNYLKVLELKPSNGTALWNLSLVELMQGNYQKGFSLFESRFSKTNPIKVNFFGLPRWDGNSLAGKSILVVTEQAFGDALQFCRYLPLLAEQGATVHLYSRLKPLVGLLSSLDGVASVTNAKASTPDCDCAIPMLSLPLLFGTTLDNIPKRFPYLRPGNDKLGEWQERLANENSFKVGIVWKGRKAPDPRRSTTLRDFAPCAEIEGISWYSLQLGNGSEEAEAPPKGMKLTDLTNLIEDFEDTAALILNLDLIISIDSAVAHLAGALAKPVWTLLPFAPDWRWMLERNDSPWYPSMKLFRQRRPGDWESVFRDVTVALCDVNHS